MIVQELKEHSIRKEYFTLIRLSKANREIAERYLDMDQPEDPELFAKIGHQDLASSVNWVEAKADYVKWLQKRKRTEELERLVRLLVEVGGPTAWRPLTSYEYAARPEKLEKLLDCLKGPRAKAQKAALRAGLCTQSLLLGRPEDVKKVCGAGKENPETFLEALKYCNSQGCMSGSEQERYTYMLLQAMYLYHTETGAAPEVTRSLEDGLTAALEDMMAFERRESVCIREFARTADRETPFPNRILSIYGQRRTGTNQPARICACAFLALRHSVRFEILLRLTAAVDYRYQGRNIMLFTCMGVAEEAYFDIHMAQLEDMLPIPDENYIIWCLEYGYMKAVERMADKCPDGIREAAAKAGSNLYRELMEIIQKMDAEISRELKADYQKTYRDKITSELVLRVSPGRAEAKEYLLGNGSVEVLAPFIREWGNDLYEEKDIYERLNTLKRMDPSMYRRGIVLEALRKMAGYFAHWPVFDQEPGVQEEYALLTDERQMDGILQIFEKENIPVRYQMEALGGMGDCLNKKKKAEYLDRCVELFIRKGQETDAKRWKEEMAETVREGSPSACCLGLRVLDQSGGGAYRDLFFSCAGSGIRQVRTLLADICRKYREWMPETLGLLESKKVKEREFAVLLLGEWGDPSCLEAVRTALSREKNKKLAASLQELLGELEQEAGGADAEQSGRAKRTEENLASEIYKGSRKKKVEWVQSLSLPDVHRLNGEFASKAYLFAILTAYASMDFPGVNEDAGRLASALAPEELSNWMMALYEGWLSAGAEAKKRWVLYAVSIHGGKAVVPVLHQQIKDWAEHSRGAMAAEAVHALAQNGSPEALRLVDQMSRKFRFRQVKNAAGEALRHAAEALCISREELEDRLVPDGPEGMTKKQLKDTLASQKLRLERAMLTPRFWEPLKWRELFVDRPLLRPFAVGLVWGVYEGEERKAAFRYMDDGTFNTAEGEAYLFPESGRIGLVHPLELSREELAAWKEQLSDYEITQPLEQLQRPVFQLEEKEKEELAFGRLEDRSLNGLTLSGRLLKMGWVRGEIQDAGFFENYYRADGAFGAELTFSGCSVGMENEEVTIGKLYFHRLAPAGSDGGTHAAFQKENRCPLKDVDPRYFSEIVRQASAAAGA